LSNEIGTLIDGKVRRPSVKMQSDDPDPPHNMMSIFAVSAIPAGAWSMIILGDLLDIPERDTVIVAGMAWTFGTPPIVIGVVADVESKAIETLPVGTTISARSSPDTKATV
jgi:hypothetical protein